MGKKVSDYENSLISKKKIVSERRAALMFLMLMDFIFTYIGVNVLNYITEANPILVQLFELNVFVSLAIRLAHMLCIYIILKYINDKRPRLSSAIVNFAISINAIILFMHIYWIFIYAGII